MPSRAQTITALILAGAAVAAAPAVAASMLTGFRGPDEALADRGLPIALPAMTPMPTPQISPDVSRAMFDLDPEKALAALATITRSRDGTVTETPASAGVRAALEEMLKGSTGD
jgi:hypothetical protein